MLVLNSIDPSRKSFLAPPLIAVTEDKQRKEQHDSETQKLKKATGFGYSTKAKSKLTEPTSPSRPRLTAPRVLGLWQPIDSGLFGT